MAASVVVVARFVAKPGKEEQLRRVLLGLIAPTRRELGCYLYDLVVSTAEPGEFAFIERWDGDAALDRHLEAGYMQAAMPSIEELVQEPPEIRRYAYV